MEVDHISHDLMNQFQRKLDNNVGGSCYGKQVWTGLHSTIEQEGVFGKLKTLAGAIFGTYFTVLTTYISIDGAVRIAKWSIEEHVNGHPLPSDIGHGGEWLEQPFQNLFIIHLLYISTMSNEGHLFKVKQMYAKFTRKILNGDEELDVSKLYLQIEDDLKFLAKRSFRPINYFEIKLKMIQIFQHVDTTIYRCLSLDIDRELEGEYRLLMKEIKALNSWNPKNFLENWRIGLYLLGKRGIGQAVEKSLYFTLFQIVMLVASGFILVGLSVVIDEVLISKRNQESSGHLSEWSLEILANLFMIRYSYLIMIKREAMLHRTRRVMKRHLDHFTGDRARLIEIMNQVLDHMAEKCHFTRLPSSYRFKPELS